MYARVNHAPFKPLRLSNELCCPDTLVLAESAMGFATVPRKPLSLVRSRLGVFSRWGTCLQRSTSCARGLSISRCFSRSGASGPKAQHVCCGRRGVYQQVFSFARARPPAWQPTRHLDQGSSPPLQRPIRYRAAPSHVGQRQRSDRDVWDRHGSPSQWRRRGRRSAERCMIHEKGLEEAGVLVWIRCRDDILFSCLRVRGLAHMPLIGNSGGSRPLCIGLRWRRCRARK